MHQENRDRLEPLPTRNSSVISPNQVTVKSPQNQQQNAFSAHIYKKAIKSLNSKHRQLNTNQENIIQTTQYTSSSRSNSVMSDGTHKSQTKAKTNHLNEKSNVTIKVLEKPVRSKETTDTQEKAYIIDKAVVYREINSNSKRNTNLQQQKDILMGLKVRL